MSTTLASFDGWPLIGATPAGGKSRLLTVDGWLAKAMRRDREAKAGQDGDWTNQGLIDGRPVTLTGTIEYGLDAASAALERRQIQALGGKGLAELAIQDALGALSAMVEVDGLRAVPSPRDTLTAWALVLHAPDPVLYGPSMYATTILEAVAAGTGRVWPRVWPRDWGTPAGVTPGAVTLPNGGTATYWPRLRIDGPVINPVVTLAETGAWVRIGRTIESGQWVDLDLGLRRVLLNGQVSIRSQVTFSGNWLGVPPGGASMSWAADTADPAALLHCWSHESAWN